MWELIKILLRGPKKMPPPATPVATTTGASESATVPAKPAVLLSPRSERNLEEIHPDLVRVVRRMAANRPDLEFVVIEGLRTQQRQKELVAAGASRTMNSRHLTGHAVDIAAMVKGNVRWDWPLYHQIAAAMKDAAHEEDVPIVWGGDWITFKDGPHFELDRMYYP